MTLAHDTKITPDLVKSHGLKPDEYERFVKLLGGYWLDQVADRAGGQGAEDNLGVVEDREHDNVQAGHELKQTWNALVPLHAGEVHIHDHQVRLEPWKLLQRLLRMGDRTYKADALHAGLKKLADRFTDFGVVIDQ